MNNVSDFGPPIRTMCAATPRKSEPPKEQDLGQSVNLAPHSQDPNVVDLV